MGVVWKGCVNVRFFEVVHWVGLGCLCFRTIRYPSKYCSTLDQPVNEHIFIPLLLSVYLPTNTSYKKPR